MALSPWVTSLALSWPMHRSETCTNIRALPPRPLSKAGRRSTRGCARPDGRMLARRGAGARKRQPARHVAGASRQRRSGRWVRAVGRAPRPGGPCGPRWRGRAASSARSRASDTRRLQRHVIEMSCSRRKKIEPMISSGKMADMIRRFSPRGERRRVIACGGVPRREAARMAAHSHRTSAVRT